MPFDENEIYGGRKKRKYTNLGYKFLFGFTIGYLSIHLIVWILRITQII